MSERRPGITVELEVPFHDVDALHVVWHGHYYKYLELARTALLRAHGLDMAELVQLGYRLVVIESKCRYAAPLHYGERFQVEAWLGDIDHRILVNYEIRSLTAGRRTARGRTVLVTTTPNGALLFETPAVIRRCLGN